LLAACVALGWTVEIDRAATSAAIASRTPFLSALAVNFTALGSVPVVTLIAVLAAAYGLVVRRPRLVLALACTPLAFVVNETMKLLLRQARPIEAIIMLPPSYGFPSGHSVAASALFLTLALVAWSRVYLGVHYLTDVVGGLLLGSAGALAAARLADARDAEGEVTDIQGDA
jgi:undecaprenyl-diphosphatase